MLILSKENIDHIFTMREAIQASKEALALYSNGKTMIPLRMRMDIAKQNAIGLFMPAYAETLDSMGIKIVSIFPKNTELNKPVVLAQMILISGETGEVIALIDGTYLTQLRTGALAGAATDILAIENAKIAALFGTGGQAGKQLEALLTVRQLQEIRVCGTDYTRTQTFVTTMQKKFSQLTAKIIAVKTSQEAINNADIITAITNSKTPVFNGHLVKPGAHINGMGSFTPDMQELPADSIKMADKIFFDTKVGVLAEAGDFLIPMKKGIVTQNDFDGDLGEVILSRIKGREAENEITLFKSVGTAVLDLITAFKIYQKALELNIGTKIEI